MTDKEVRKQIEDEFKKETECNPINPGIDIYRVRYIEWLEDQLIKERKLSASKQETIDNFILGRREE
jgi:hypothetical protein